MANKHGDTYIAILETLKMRPYSTSSWLFEKLYPFVGHIKYQNFKRMVSRARHDLFDSLVNSLCHFYATSSTLKLSLEEIDSLLFNDVSTSISSAYHSEDTLHVLTHSFLPLCNNRVISNLDSVFTVDFSVHSGGVVGRHMKLRHFSFDIPWGYFGVFGKACRVDFGSTYAEKGNCGLTPRFIIFDKSKGHNHEPHVETDSIDTFLKVLSKRFEGYSGDALWKELNGKVSFYTGGPRRTREERWKLWYKKHPEETDYGSLIRR